MTGGEGAAVVHVAAGVLAAHELRLRSLNEPAGCHGCDWSPGSEVWMHSAVARAHRDHVAEALAAALAPVVEGAVRERVKGHRWLGGYFCECGHELNSAAGHLEHVMAAAFGRSAHE